MIQAAIKIPQAEIGRFCHQWQIKELAFFGSVLRDDFGPDSDVDILVAFEPDAQWSLFDHLQMQQELSAILGKDVDLISKWAVQHSDNWLRRQEILDTAQVFYHGS